MPSERAGTRRAVAETDGPPESRTSRFEYVGREASDVAASDVETRDVRPSGGDKARSIVSSEVADVARGPIFAVTPAGHADRREVLGLWLALVEYHRSIDPQYPELPGLRDVLTREIDRVLRSRDARVLLLRESATAVGFVIAELESGGPEAGSVAGEALPLCWIHELYVVPEARGRGGGSALVEAAEAFFVGRSGGRLAVRVEEANTAGLSFWQRRGFGTRARVLERRVR